MASIYQTENGWRAQVRRKGHPNQTAYFKTKQEAQRWARKVEHELDERKRTPRGLSVTIADMVDAYVEHTARMGRSKRWGMDKIRAELGHLRLEELDRQAVQNYIAKREKEGAGPTTLQYDFSYLGTLLKYGGALVDADEAAGMARLRLESVRSSFRHSGRLRKSRERTRRPTQEELEKIAGWFARRHFSAIEMFDITLLAICTCLRRGEIVSLRWEDFDPETRTIIVRDRKHPMMKQGNDDRLPLLTGVVKWRGEDVDPVAIIHRARSAYLKQGRIYPYSPYTIGHAFAAAARACKIQDLHFHDLRHDGVSRLFEAGFDIPEVALVSGHRTWKNLARYTHLRAEDLQKKLEPKVTEK